ncbi:hypothetical protein KL86DES1_21129 [uncultured Desulfovibrio sp.]|uniref:Uncharacterized protein n=1 Tax=uncultured Desulfovibrio sp. TaxID=167968 RepID=A0A212L6K7_9BACT|nr:hypothetical protein KL86DES1_21129 [uncultured Desulfovibrio sp.]VZH34027.1 conserved protein of unknown function [Desulfovibrio sp. 86]
MFSSKRHTKNQHAAQASKAAAMSKPNTSIIRVRREEGGRFFMEGS